MTDFTRMADDKRQRHRRFVRQFLDALERDDFDAAGKLIEEASLTGIDVDQPSFTGGPTPLQSLLVAPASGSAVADLCRRLVAAGADVNRREPATGETSLHQAAKLGRDDLVDALVESSSPDVVDLDAGDSTGLKPLGTAINFGSLAVARRLILAGCNVNRSNDAGETPLMSCSRQNLVEFSRLLVDHDADLNLTDRERRTALIVAVQLGHAEVADVLIDAAGCSLNACDQYNRSALYFAAKHGHKGIVERLVAAHADINKRDTRGLTPFSMAVEGLHMDIISLLMQAGCDVNTADTDNRQTAIQNAIRFSAKVFGQYALNQQLVRLLIDDVSCDVNVADKFGYTPLYQAASGGETEIVRLLLNKGADVTKVTKTMETALHGAVVGNRPEIVEMLIKAGCQINGVNDKNKLPLYLAIENKAENQIVRLLLEAGSETDVCESKSHQSPLFAAVSQQFNDAVDLLINAGCDVNLSDSAGSTPLLMACTHGNDAIVEALLRHPSVDVDRGLLQIPLHAAAASGSCSIVQRLINAGCDVNKLTLTGQAALFQAADHDHLDVARILVQHGASPQAVGRLLSRGSLCCRAHRDPHPHLQLHPLFAAVQNNNLSMIKLLLVGSPRMPYAELATLRDVIFRTKYAAEARLGDRTLVQYGYLFTGVLRKPRSMMEECRGVIRDALCFGRACRRLSGCAQGLKLKQAVDKLTLPDRLKEYVLLGNEPIVVMSKNGDAIMTR